MAEDDERSSSTEPVTRLVPGQRAPGEDMSRILALTDGVFAFSLTLLVLSLVVPAFTTFSGEPAAQISGRLGFLLRQELGSFFGYVFVFVMIAVWWSAHHRIFRWIVRYDDVLVGLNLALLMEIAVMPFVLKVYITYASTPVAVILFALIQLASGLTLSFIWLYASRGYRLIRRTIPVYDVRWMQYRTYLTPAVFAISIGVVFINVDAAQIVWIAALFAQRFTWFAAAVHGRPLAGRDR
ncbi:MAG: TMEM175 family protein [Thermoplasmata archaeon]